jgi:hypothetical protein
MGCDTWKKNTAPKSDSSRRKAHYMVTGHIQKPTQGIVIIDIVWGFRDDCFSQA